MQPANKHCPSQLVLDEGWILMGEETPLDMFISLQMGNTLSAPHNFTAIVLSLHISFI